jgi:predicted O-methyltransferase YrrM
MARPTSNGARDALGDRLSRLELTSGWRTAAYHAYLAGHRVADRLGWHVVRASYDSPIPQRADRTPAAIERESPMRGVPWDPAMQLEFVERELAPYLDEFRPSGEPSAPPGVFRLDNQTYDRVDAELLYAMVRWARPARHVELGSGYSSLVTAQALRANADAGSAGHLRCYDPYPSPHVLARADLAPLVQRTAVQDLPEDVVTDLHAGDILFVDTSHTVKLGGDVNRIVLDLLPLVAPGVVVHFHDIFLPGEYSAAHLRHAHFWNEQYLLQAFLSGNPGWEILVGAQALARAHPARLGELIPSFRPGVSPAAFWIRRRAADAPAR